MTSTLKIDRVEYHRNGSGGEGFHLVQFRHRESGRTFTPLLATVFEERGYCAVIDPASPGLRWRGDVFEAELREAIAKANEDGSAFEHEVPCPARGPRGRECVYTEGHVERSATPHRFDSEVTA